MKKIHFDQLNFRDSKAQFILLVLALFLVIINTFEFWTFKNTNYLKLITIVIFLFIAVIHSQFLWYKNFVQWNKKRIVIKLNELFLGKTFKFDEISNFDFANNQLTISKFDGERKIFDLSNIELESIEKLKNILKSNT
ncbi:hypothetical protein [Riemerella anatipestifer]|uniref:hypothetical protein n=1 Tax=Riemerella anatipestifer TaxID=34085 RepID=UPI00129E10CA|nr:hypothetical protein [Riemerella anatipestifer]MRM83892.1 hypothetical protein [Riemerella anatipestifer]